MSIRTSKWPAGVPCWTDLAAPDVPAAMEFYEAVLGWEFTPSSPEYGGYQIAARNGGATAGIGQLPPGGNAAWTIYFAGDDADKLAAAVTEHGGTLIMPPGDVGPAGRMFIGADPTGASFGVWQAGEMIGAGLVNEPGGLVWEDLRSTDPDRARAFYSAVFGFAVEPLPAAGPEYSVFSAAPGEPPLGGIGGTFGAPGPSNWSVCFAVDDADEAVTAAVRQDGSLVQGPDDTEYGRLAVLADPFGAEFQIMQPLPAVQHPDREG